MAKANTTHKYQEIGLTSKQGKLAALAKRIAKLDRQDLTDLVNARGDDLQALRKTALGKAIESLGITGPGLVASSLQGAAPAIRKACDEAIEGADITTLSGAAISTAARGVCLDLTAALSALQAVRQAAQEAA